MQTDRHIRVTELLRSVTARFIQQEANTTPLITVTHVTISPDYRKATVYVTTIPDDREEDALVFLKRNGSHLRQYIKKSTNLKYIPHVDFAIDRGERHRQHIDSLVEELDVPTSKPAKEDT